MINHDFRRQGIGGSDVAAILGISPFKHQTPLALWHYIKDCVTPADNAAMKNGREQEKFILDTYEKEKDIYLMRNQPLIDKQEPVLRCNVDGIQQPIVIVEVKTSFTRNGWGQEGTAEVPNNYLTQGAHCRRIGDVEFVEFVVKFADSDRLHYYRYYPNKKLENKLRDEVLEWWEKYIIGNVEPDPINEYDQLTFINQKHLTAPDNICKIIQGYANDREIKNAAEKEMKEKAAAIRAWIKENNIDGKVAVWDENGKKLGLQIFHTSSKMDAEKLKADGIDVEKYKVNKLSLALKIN